MAKRIVFTPKATFPWYNETLVAFEWVPGLAKSQAQKSIRNLHESARLQMNLNYILEVSTKSEETLGQQLSAFNLIISRGSARSSLESTYQASKIFEGSIQLVDLLDADALSAKTDPRLRTSGKLTGFNFEDQKFHLLPSPNFYDYLYVRALIESGLSEKVEKFEAFTDHAFSGIGKIESGKSVNCQARSLAIFLGLLSIEPLKSILDELFTLATRAIPHEQAALFDF